MKEGASLKLKFASVAVLVLAGALLTFALVLQFYFSEKKIENWADDFILQHQASYNQKHPSQKVSVDYDKVHLSFLASFTYPLGLRVKGLKVRLQSRCEILKGEFETVVIPIHLSQALKKKMHLGLVRLSEGLLKKQNLCEEVSTGEVKKSSVLTRDQKLKKALDQFVGLAHTKEVASFFDLNQERLRYLGFVFYDLKIMLHEDLKIHLQRFKFLYGLGLVKGKGEWNAEIQISDEKSDLEGSLKVFEDRFVLKSQLNDKESFVWFDAESSRLEKKAKGKLEIRDLPLSRLSHLGRMSVKGLNLRRVWLDLDLNFELSPSQSQFEMTHFKSRGDFGQVSTGREKLYVFWSDQDQIWKQKENLEIKVTGLVLSEIFEDLPQKKLHGVFGRLGNLNAYFRLKDLKKLRGDFEILEPSVLFRSMGKVSEQQIKYIRGNLQFQAKKSLSVSFRDVQLVDGDFDGEILLNYDYNAREVKTKFQLEQVNLDPKIVSGVFSVNKLENLSLKGEGRADKTKLLRKKGRDATLSFSFQLKALKDDHWDFEGLSGSCVLEALATYTCLLAIKKILISEALKSELELKQNNFREIINVRFVFSDKKVKMEIPLSVKRNLELDWASQKGASARVKSSDSVSKTVYLRAL